MIISVVKYGMQMLDGIIGTGAVDVATPAQGVVAVVTMLDKCKKISN